MPGILVYLFEGSILFFNTTYFARRVRRALRATPDARWLVRIEDADGNLVPRAKVPVRFSVSGPAQIVATDNGDATCLIAFPSPERPTYNGLALAIVRALPEASGIVRLMVESPGLPAAETTLRIE